jgi:hypothetical protein
MNFTNMIKPSVINIMTRTGSAGGAAGAAARA